MSGQKQGKQEKYTKPDDTKWTELEPRLQRKLSITIHFLSILEKNGVITYMDSSEIRTQNSNSPAAAKKTLLDIVINGDEGTYEKFIQALQETLQGGVLEVLKPSSK